MKVFHVANIRLPTEKAHGIQIMKMSEAMAEAGAEVELIVPSRGGNVLRDRDAFEYYSVKPVFRIRYLPSFDPAFLRRLKQGIYVKFQLTFFLASLFVFLLFAKTQGMIFYTRNEYLLPLLLRFSKNVSWEPHTLPRNKSAYLRYWKKCAGIVAISHGLQKDLVEMGLDGDKIIVAPDGVDLSMAAAPESRAKVREKLGFAAKTKVVMYTGHLYEWKGAAVLLDAARQAGFQQGDVKFVFVGGTDFDIEKFRKAAAGLENVLILGHQPHAEIAAYLASADVLVLPNSGKFEIGRVYTSPLKLFEYMASGRPVVVSDLPSIREILNEKNAILVEPDNPLSLAKGIETALQNPAVADRISKQAFQDVQGYTWQHRASQILAFLRR